jgi:hypothetical protein
MFNSIHDNSANVCFLLSIFVHLIVKTVGRQRELKASNDGMQTDVIVGASNGKDSLRIIGDRISSTKVVDELSKGV